MTAKWMLSPANAVLVEGIRGLCDTHIIFAQINSAILPLHTSKRLSSSCDDVCLWSYIRRELVVQNQFHQAPNLSKVPIAELGSHCGVVAADLRAGAENPVFF